MALHRILIIGFSMMVLFLIPELCAQEGSILSLRHVLTLEGVEREYFVHRPQANDSNRRTWLVVVVHGGGGTGRSFWLLDGIQAAMKDLGLNAIVVSPSFSNTDFQASRFPALGEGAFLKLVIDELRSEFRLHKKVLLTGYSRGGQFTHRFAFQNPKLVKACATFSAGTWTTPDGRLLIESMEPVNDPEAFLSINSNAALVPERLRSIFEPRVARVAGMRPKPGARKIPFLVMCGTLDPRLNISREFVARLEDNGFKVQNNWPDTPHPRSAEYSDQFLEYSMGAVQFFLEVISKR